MSRQLCNCSSRMTHPCTTPAPKQNLHMVQTLVLDGKPEPKCTGTALSTHRYRTRRNGKSTGHFSQARAGGYVHVPTCSASAARGNSSINKIIIVLILSRLVEEQAAVRGASKAPCKASPEAHSDENWIHFPSPVFCSPCPAQEEL